MNDHISINIYPIDVWFFSIVRGACTGAYDILDCFVTVSETILYLIGQKSGFSHIEDSDICVYPLARYDHKESFKPKMSF